VQQLTVFLGGTRNSVCCTPHGSGAAVLFRLVAVAWTWNLPASECWAAGGGCSNDARKRVAGHEGRALSGIRVISDAVLTVSCSIGC
jgi:hypothetical protein